MEKSSIKQTLPRMAKIMTLVLIILILPVNIWLQLSMQHKGQRESSYEVFSQLKQLIEINEWDLEQTRQEFSQKCIQSAEMAAYFVEHYPSVKSNLEHTRELAEKLDVEELHYFTPEGEIYFGTHPEYYGYTFHSGEQMEFFLPMLEDHSMKLCQDITPNTAENKEMQYAAVWLEDGSGIVQIGVEPERLLKEIQERSLTKLISAFPLGLQGSLHIVDRDLQQIIASTEKERVGMDVSDGFKNQVKDLSPDGFHYQIEGELYCVYKEDYGKYILLRTYNSKYPLKETITSTLFVLIYIFAAATIVIGLITWYVNKKLSDNLRKIVDGLKKIENGNLESITLKTGISEFDDLIFYINQLMKSIRLNWSKLSYVIDKGRLPIGIFEYNTFYKKAFVNERLLNILGIEYSETEPWEETVKNVKKLLEETYEQINGKQEDACEYNKNGKIVYLRIEKITDEQSITYYVTDISLWWEEIHMLREQNNRDVLTSLYNRRGFNEQLEELFAEPGLNYGMMIMLDADGLKRINDIYGHIAGDEYLKEIAGVITEAVGENAVCARLGGDEFAVFLYHYSSYQAVEESVNRIKEKRGQPFTSKEAKAGEKIEFSLGCAFYPMDGQDYHLLMHLADENMYQEKRNRKIRGGVLKNKTNVLDIQENEC